MNAAGEAVTTGVQNTFVGGLAGDATDDGTNNVAVGFEALSANCGSGNVVLGCRAGKANTASNNVFIGLDAGKLNQGGSENVAIGRLAFDANTAGTNNVAMGNGALGSNTDADYNVAIGDNAGALLTTGGNNTFVGAYAGDATDDGTSNVAVGVGALSANCGNQNSAVGKDALLVATGATNTAVGQAAGVGVTSGSNNAFFGVDAGRSSSPGGNITTESNVLTLGDNNIATANIKVDWTVSSDQRDKTDFTALDLGLDFVKALKPVTYKWDERSNYGDKEADDWSLADQTPDGTHKKDWLDIGFKAQEVEALEIAAGYNKSNKTNLTVSLSPDGEQYGMKYSKFVPILVKGMQELSAKLDAALARIDELES